MRLFFCVNYLLQSCNYFSENNCLLFKIVAAEQFLGKKFPDNSADAYLLLTFDGNSKE